MIEFRTELKKRYSGFLSSSYLKDGIFLVLEKVFRLFINFFIGIFVINYLGPEKYGQISYAITIVLILEIFVYLGLDSVIVRKLVESPLRSRQIVSGTFGLKLIVSVLISAVWLIIIIYNNDQFNPWINIPLILVIILKPLDTIDLFFQANKLNYKTALIRTVSLVFLGVSNLILVLYDSSLELFIYPFILERVLTAILLYSFYSKYEKTIFSGNQYGEYISLLKEGMYLFLSGIAYIVNIRFDVILIEYYLGFSSVGVYTAATKITESLFLLPTSLLVVLFPIMIKRIDNTKYLLKIIVPIGFILLFISFLVSTLSEDIIGVLYTQEFIESSSILAIHSFLLVLIFFDGISVRIIVIQKRYQYAFFRSIIMVSSGVFLNVFFLPVFGIIASAWSILCVYLIGLGMMLIDQGRYRTNPKLVDKVN